MRGRAWGIDGCNENETREMRTAKTKMKASQQTCDTNAWHDAIWMWTCQLTFSPSRNVVVFTSPAPVLVRKAVHFEVLLRRYGRYPSEVLRVRKPAVEKRRENNLPSSIIPSDVSMLVALHYISTDISRGGYRPVLLFFRNTFDIIQIKMASLKKTLFMLCSWHSANARVICCIYILARQILSSSLTSSSLCISNQGPSHSV